MTRLEARSSRLEEVKVTAPGATAPRSCSYSRAHVCMVDIAVLSKNLLGSKRWLIFTDADARGRLRRQRALLQTTTIESVLSVVHGRLLHE